MQSPRVRVVLAVGVLTLLGFAASGNAQPWSPDSISLSVAGGGAQCSYVEVVMTSGLTMGHESTSVRSSGAGFVQGWDEKCGWGKGPCAADAGTGEWNPAIGYGGPLHLIYQLTSSPAARFWVVWDDGHVGPPIYTTREYPVSVTPAAAKTAGLWSTRSDLPADGKSEASLTVAASGPTCGALRNAPVVLTTSHGRLRAGTQEGASITVTTGNNGRAAAILIAADTAGTAHVTADIGGATAETTVRMTGYDLTLSATPEMLAADGKTSGLVTATLTDGAGGVAVGQSVTLSTDRGTLRDTAGQTGTSITGTTNSQGEYFASLQSTDTPGTAHVKASFTNGSKTYEATKDVEFKGPEVTLTAQRTEYRSVPSGHGLQGSAGSIPVVGTARVPFRDAVEPSHYGRSTVEFTAKLTLGTTPASGKTILVTSPQRDAVGASFIDFPPSVTTSADGTVTFTFETDDLWKAGIALPHITLKATSADDATVFTEFDVRTIDNLSAVLARYQGAVTGGIVSDDAVVAAIDRLSPHDRELLNGLYPGVRNDLLASGAYAAASTVIGGHRADFLASTSPWWQWKVLTFLNNLQWTSYWSTSGAGDNRWLLNGLHFGPLFVEGDRHLAAVIYPQGETWDGADAQVLDPWIQQQPVSYAFSEWKRLLANDEFLRSGSGVNVQTHAFTPGTFPSSGSLADHYPVNGDPYYGDIDAVPAPADSTTTPAFADYFTTLESLVVDCPVFVTIEDALGRKSGYAPPPSAEPTVDEVPGALRSTLRGPDGTLRWVFNLPKDVPLTVRVRAYGTGTMTLTLLRAAQGRRWVYRGVPVTAGETASLAFAPGALAPPALQFAGGRTVAGAIEPVGTSGAMPSEVLIGGGGSVIVGGIVFDDASLLQPGATVTIGGRAASDVTVLNGSTLSAVVPAGTATGPADIVVTNSGGQQVTLAGGFVYAFARQYLAEGATGTFFDTSVALLNPQESSVWGQLRFLKSDRTTVEYPFTIGARSRATVNVRDVAGMATAEFATTVETSLPAVVDRTMTWSRDAKYGSHAERGIAAPALTWYLAEGATHSGFDLFYLLQNPNAEAAEVRVRFLRPAPAAPLERTYTIAPRSRFNVWVDTLDLPEGSGQLPLASTDVSAVIDVLNQQPIIVERAMYLTASGRPFDAGHESAGVTAPNTRWFLAEGATGPTFDLFVLVANPTDQAAEIEVRYLLTDGTVYSKGYSVAANSRFNIWVNLEEIPAGSGLHPLADVALSTAVSSTNGVPVIVERSMWWPRVGWYEAHNSPGSTVTGTSWALAEGAVGGTAGDDTYILIANTADRAGTARVTLLFENGTTAVREYGLPANSRTNVWVAAEFPAAAGQRFGAIVESLGETPAEIVVERAIYSSLPGLPWAAGSNALATKLR